MVREKPYHLLIADDDVSFRGTLREIFQPRLHTLEAASGEEAIEIIERGRVDILLLDMHMDVLTGLDTLKIVKSIDEELPCILITADLTEQLRRDATDARAWSVMAKPVRKYDLMRTVSSALSDAYGDPDAFSCPA